MGCPNAAPSPKSISPARIPSTMNSRVIPYSFWVVTSLKTAPLRFHSPYSAMADQIPRRDHLENQQHWSTVADCPMCWGACSWPPRQAAFSSLSNLL